MWIQHFETFFQTLKRFFFTILFFIITFGIFDPFSKQGDGTVNREMENVAEIIEAGRARWKVENENNNVLKTKGYHLEHNFGHGKKYLASLLLTLNIIAFLFHTVLEMMDEKYQLIRDNLPTRKTFFDDIRALTRYICFDSWDEMLTFMIRGLEIELIDTS
jgi:hypothetical protein